MVALASRLTNCWMNCGMLGVFDPAAGRVADDIAGHEAHCRVEVAACPRLRVALGDLPGMLEQRPGAFEYAKPLRQWRQEWPACYHLLLRRLREKWPEGRGVKEFVQVLRLHQQYPARQIEQAVEQAITYGCTHFDGVKHCLEHLGEEADRAPLLDLTDKPHLALVGNQPLDLGRYDQLIERYAHL